MDCQDLTEPLSSTILRLGYAPFYSERSLFFPKDDFAIYTIRYEKLTIPGFHCLHREMLDILNSDSENTNIGLENSLLRVFFLRDNCWLKRFTPRPVTSNSKALLRMIKKRPDVEFNIMSADPANSLVRKSRPLEEDSFLSLEAGDQLQVHLRDTGDLSPHTVFALLWEIRTRPLERGRGL